MSERKLPGYVSRRNTSNATYGSYIPDATYWQRSYLQYTPIAIKNRQLDRYRSKLRTSSEEYGNYWTEPQSARVTPFYLSNDEHIRKNPNYNSNPDLLKTLNADEEQQKADELWRKLRAERDNQAIVLPPIEDFRGMDTLRATVPRSEMQKVHLPEIKQIDILLHMNDSSVVTLKTIPHKPYQFHQ